MRDCVRSDRIGKRKPQESSLGPSGDVVAMGSGAVAAAPDHTLPSMSNRSPAEVLRHELAEGRRRGEDFDTAWRRALVSATAGMPFAGSWRQALYHARGAFERSYNGQPSARGDRVRLEPEDTLARGVLFPYDDAA
jgi:hypothetical protein